MKNLFLLPLITLALGANAAPSTPNVAPIYLVCTGEEYLYTSSWLEPAGKMDESSKLTIKLSQGGTKATTTLLILGEQTFDLTTDGEYYTASKRLNLARLDGLISKATISMNRITGLTYVSFTVTDSPRNRELVAFLGNCQRGSAQF